MVTKLLKNLSGELMSDDNIESMVRADDRLLLITKARWIVIGIIFLCGLITAVAYANFKQFSELLELTRMPILIFLIMIAYNSFYHWGWHSIPRFWKTHISFLIKLQFFIDILAVTALIHYTGGISSWFWGLYIIFTLGLTYLIPSQKEVIKVGIFASLCYTLLIFLEYLYIIPTVKLTFIDSTVQHNINFVLIAWFWVNLTNICTALISTYMHGKEKTAVKEKIVTDGLTGLYNRRYFDHILNSEIARAERYGRIVSLLMIDIDDFKVFNDTFGHTAGDDLLKIISSVLKLNVRGGSTPFDIDVVCRYGGEEFSVILPETGEKGSLETAKRIREKLNEHINHAFITAERLRESVKNASSSSSKKGVTISIGVASFPLHAKTSSLLISKADEALYKAKNEGKNKTIVAKIWESSEEKVRN